MKRSTTFAALLLLPFLALPVADSLAQSNKSIVGTWIMVSNINTDASGKKTDTFSANPKGWMAFGADGRYVNMVVKPDLPKIAAKSRIAGTQEENAAIV